MKLSDIFGRKTVEDKLTVITNEIIEIVRKIKDEKIFSHFQPITDLIHSVPKEIKEEVQRRKGIKKDNIDFYRKIRSASGTQESYVERVSALIRQECGDSLESRYSNTAIDKNLLRAIDKIIFDDELEKFIIKIFVSYAHKDLKEAEIIFNRLKALDSSDIWIDSYKLRMGVHWREKICEAINESDSAILLISKNFLKSYFIMNTEVPAIEQSHKEDNLNVIPLRMKPCDLKKYENIKWIKENQIKPAEPIWSWLDLIKRKLSNIWITIFLIIACLMGLYTFFYIISPQIIFGRVVYDGSDLPVKNAKISVYSKSDNTKPLDEKTTDENGCFIFLLKDFKEPEVNIRICKIITSQQNIILPDYYLKRIIRYLGYNFKEMSEWVTQWLSEPPLKISDCLKGKWDCNDNSIWDINRDAKNNPVVTLNRKIGDIEISKTEFTIEEDSSEKIIIIYSKVLSVKIALGKDDINKILITLQKNGISGSLSCCKNMKK